MKDLLFAFFASWLVAVHVAAVPSAAAPPLPTLPNGKSVLGDVATTWPGIHYRVSVIKRIPPGRLLVVVWICGSSETPPKGISLSVPNPAKPPPGVSPAFFALHTPPLPFSLMPTTMTDDLSQQLYSALPPVTSAGGEYRPYRTRVTLRPTDFVILTLQFAIPPPPPPPPPGTPPKQQTVSFLFPKAVGPMAHLPLPPPDAPAGTPP